MQTATSLIVLVENDPPASRAMVRLLSASGYRVAAFASAEAMLARDESEPIACLLLDVDLDGSSNGPIVFLTGRADPDAEINARRYGCSDFLYQPVPGSVLLAAIDSAMGAAAAQRIQ